MGNYRFKLSNMMPNAWFYKLRDMNKPRNQNPSNPTKKKFLSPTQNPRKSFYHSSESMQSEKFYTSPKNMKAFDTQFPRDPPRRSSKTKTRRKTIYKPSPTQINPSVCVCHEPQYPVWLKPGTVHDNCRSTLDFPTSPDQDFLESLSSEYEWSDSLDVLHGDGIESWSRSSSFKLSSDIIIDMGKMSCDTQKVNKSTEFELISELGLPPILTKLSQHNDVSKSPQFKENRIQPKQKTRKSSRPASRKSFSRNNNGMKIRNKLTSKKNEIRERKSMKGEKKGGGVFNSESFAVVKASFDPEQDFRESMMEMIVENNIRASKDLEDLLACYLSLNSNHYHDLIIKAFEQIWFTMPQH